MPATLLMSFDTSLLSAPALDADTESMSTNIHRTEQIASQKKQDEGLHSMESKSLVNNFDLGQLHDRLASLKEIAHKCEFGFGTSLDLILTGERPSLLSVYTGHKKLSYGPPTSIVIQSPSSGEESEDELPLNSNDPAISNKMSAQ